MRCSCSHTRLPTPILLPGIDVSLAVLTIFFLQPRSNDPIEEADEQFSENKAYTKRKNKERKKQNRRQGPYHPLTTLRARHNRHKRNDRDDEREKSNANADQEPPLAMFHTAPPIYKKYYSSHGYMSNTLLLPTSFVRM